jgi:hypothetical protein
MLFLLTLSDIVKMLDIEIGGGVMDVIKSTVFGSGIFPAQGETIWAQQNEGCWKAVRASFLLRLQKAQMKDRSFSRLLYLE